MSETEFRLVYDGESVQDGEMEIGQLAPSLLALGKLIEALDFLETGEAGRVRVVVRADIRKGSFNVGLAVDFVHAVKAWLISPTGVALAGAVTLLGINPRTGLIQAVRWLRSRRIKAKVALVDGGVRLETDDGDGLVVPEPIARAIDDPGIRQQLERFTEPLREDGIDHIRFEGGPRSEQITSGEASLFVAGAGADPTSQARFRATYQIKRLYFERGKKWRLSNGSQTILAAIDDDAFWVRVEAADVAFSSDDFLVCEVRMDQWLNRGTGLRTEYVVERVVEHTPALRQTRLPGT